MGFVLPHSSTPPSPPRKASVIILQSTSSKERVERSSERCNGTASLTIVVTRGASAVASAEFSIMRKVAISACSCAITCSETKFEMPTCEPDIAKRNSSTMGLHKASSDGDTPRPLMSQRSCSSRSFSIWKGDAAVPPVLTLDRRMVEATEYSLATE